MTRFGRALRAGLLLTGVTLVLPATSAQTQSFPQKPLRVLVGGPAGGSTDTVARLFAQGLAPLLGQPVIVENKPGAYGSIAMQEVLSAPHDGYTVTVAPNGVISESPYSIKLKYDSFKDIKPLAELARGGLILVGNPSLPAQNVNELIAHVKARPGKVSYASYSAGSLSHVMGLQMNKAAGLDMTHIGYKGAAPALQDVMGGHVPLMFDAVPSSLPMLKASKLKAYAFSGPQRSSLLPAVPTFTELGLPQLEALIWVGLFVPSDVPAAVQQKLREATLKLLQQPQFRERLKELGSDVGQPLSPEELSAGLRKDYERVGAVLQSINYKPE